MDHFPCAHAVYRPIQNVFEYEQIKLLEVSKKFHVRRNVSSAMSCDSNQKKSGKFSTFSTFLVDNSSNSRRHCGWRFFSDNFQ